MKTNLLLRFSLLSMALLLMSFIDPYTVKRVTDTNFKYEFYTTQKKIKPKQNRQYYWFKGGAIHNSESGAAGEALNDQFLKMYLNSQLAEQGQFKNGLKTGTWKTWHRNGMLQSIANWNNGIQKGDYFTYDESGNPLELGNYKNGLKHGQWIDITAKDTIVYKKGEVFVKKPKLTKEQKATAKAHKAAEAAKNPKKDNFLKRLFSKNKSATTAKPATNEPKKDGFFKRLFSKKQKQPKPQKNG